MDHNLNKKRFAFNVPNLTSLIILSKIRKDTKLDFIIQISTKLIEFYGIDTINSILRKQEKDIWFSLDHYNDLNIISQCKKEDGWTSVLFDCSTKPFDENIALSKIAKEICTANHLLLESEVTPLGLGSYSNLPEVIAFVNAVGCDLISISVGTAHGKQVGTRVNIELIEEVSKNISIPLVIHGGSGIDDSIIKKIFENGASKINISSSLKRIYVEIVSRNKEYDFKKVNKELYDAYHNFIKKKLLQE